VQTEEALKQEEARIAEEMQQLCARAEFGLRTLPLVKLTDPGPAAAFKEGEADVILIYAAGGGTNLLEAIAQSGKSLIIFVRQDSGPYYLWHEIVSARFLRRHTDQVSQPGVDEHDVVVDEQDEILWRLRALYGLKNTLGRRIVAIGGPGGWSTPAAPDLARERFRLDMVTVPVPELASMIEAGRKNEALMAQCADDAQRYLRPKDVTLHTSPEAVAEAFLLNKLFHDLMRNSDAYAVTTRGCMGSYAGIMPCLTLTLVNDAGYMAYCESDFVVIPSGILLHFIAGKPTFLCNPTYPHEGRMLFAHCTAPRRMNGRRQEPVKIVTHFESDHGAASKVQFHRGQLLTIIKPDFEAKHWLVLTGKVARTPFLPVCRSQVEVKLDADTREVIENLRGFHCQIAYGDYVREIEYAAKKVGIAVQLLSA
jgi:L-fucose isomerase-like protein